MNEQDITTVYGSVYTGILLGTAIMLYNIIVMSIYTINADSGEYEDVNNSA